MYYELIILGTLMVGTFHGYLIAKIMQNITGPYGKISKGRLYPLLTRLEASGLIVVEPVSEPQANPDNHRSQIPSRRYQITKAGRQRFHALMMDTTSYLGDYQKVFTQKVARFSFLHPVERLHLLDHYIGYCQTLVAHGTQRSAEVSHAGESQRDFSGMTSAQLADLLAVMHHTIQHWQQELLWAQELREQVKASITTPAIPGGETV